MNPIHPAQYSHLPPSEVNHGRQAYLHPFLQTYEETSSFPCAAFLNPCQGGSRESDHQRSHRLQQEVRSYAPQANQVFPSDGSTDDDGSLPATPLAAKDEESNNKSNSTTGDHSDPSSSCPGKWMPSKMRFMRKMNYSDRITTSKPRKSALQHQDQQPSLQDANNGNSSNILLSGTPIRVCSDCNTTKTPLWRSGPRGPKSLCNACGIRQRKARRAMAAAAWTGGLIPTVAPTKVPKEKRSQGECTVPFKKRCNFSTADPGKKLHVDEFAISLSKSSAFHRVFPQDEKDAAMLLMALSCGLIHG